MVIYSPLLLGKDGVSLYTKARFAYLDLLKALAVFSVCALHFPWVGNMEYAVSMDHLTILRRFLFGFYSCAVPLFLMVNGALLLNGRFSLKKHYKKLAVLSVQYLFWRAVSILLIGAWEGFDFSFWNPTTYVNVLFLHMGVDGISLNNLWFMPFLLCLYVWVPLIKAAWDHCESREHGFRLFLPFLGLLLVSCFLLEDLTLFQPLIPVFDAAFLGGLRLFLPLSSPLYCSMLFYFILGGLLHRFRDAFSVPTLPCLLAVLAAMLLLFWEWSVASSLSGVTYDNVFSSYDNLPCLLLTVALFLLFRQGDAALSPQNRLCSAARFLSTESLSIYYIHWIILATVGEYAHLTDSYCFNLLRSLLLCFFCAAISRGIKKIPLLRHLVH